MAADTGDLEGLLASLNRSAERLQTLWFSFIGLTLYVIITALTTTHMNLLLNEAQVLPIINMKVPLLPFYVIAPLFYVIVHFYVLLMLMLLARSAKVFEDELRRTIGLESERETFRMRLENTLFLQLLVGARSERRGITGRLLAAMALITIAVAPIATLLVLEMRFLPYHAFAITWLHRGTVGLDLVLVLFMWRAYRRRWGSPLPKGPIATWRGRARGWWVRWPAAVLWPAMAIWLTIGEGRWAGEPYLDPTEGLDARILTSLGLDGVARSLKPLRTDLYGVPADDLSRLGFRPLVWTGLISDRLDVSGETIVGADLVDKAEREQKSLSETRRYIRTRDFRSRDFTRANFARADLRGVDFSGDSTVLKKANLSNTSLQRADCSSAKLHDVNARGVQMQGATLFQTQMPGAMLETANMQGTNLQSANLRGAVLQTAQMQGSNLSGAQMQGANLQAARLDGANIGDASIVGANLKYTILFASYIFGSIMSYTNIEYSQMTGAELLDVRFDGSKLSNSNFFRTIHNNVNIEDSFIKSAYLKPYIYEYLGEFDLFHGIALFVDFYLVRESKISDEIIDYYYNIAYRYSVILSPRSELRARFDRLKGEHPTEDTADASFWGKAEQISTHNFPTEAAYAAYLVKALERLACDAEGDFGDDRRYVARGLLKSRADEFIAVGLDEALDHLRVLRRDPKTCPGLVSIDETDWTQTLDWMVKLRDLRQSSKQRPASPTVSAPPR
jgi:uncharacterized protein YjbI with pentapeptide repeats